MNDLATGVSITTRLDWEQTLAYLVAIKNGDVSLRIPIRNPQGEETGALLPLTVAHLGNDDLIRTFVRWRNQNLEGWLDQRPVTEEGTRRWLEKVVREPNRMSFLIAWGERIVGRCGFLNLTPEDSEGDGLVRGERGGGYYFMRDAQMAGLRWQFERLGSSSVWAKVLSTNELALANNVSLGYSPRPFDIRPIYRRQDSDGVVLTEDASAGGELCPEFQLLFLRVLRDQFDTAFRRTGFTGLSGSK